MGGIRKEGPRASTGSGTIRMIALELLPWAKRAASSASHTSKGDGLVGMRIMSALATAAAVAGRVRDSIFGMYRLRPAAE